MTPHALILVMLAQTPAAATPAGPSVQEQLLGAINRGDPDMTRTPAPVAELSAAAELAARALAHAEMTEISELLGYLHMSLDLAYRRTGDPTHLKAEIAALEPVIARPALPPELITRATRWRASACSRLESVHAVRDACAPPQATSRPEPAPTPAPIPPPSEAPKETRRKTQPMTTAGGVMLGLGGALAAASIGIQVHRKRSRNEFAEFWPMAQADGQLSPEETATLGYHDRNSRWTLVAVPVFAVAAVLVAGMGIGLITAGTVRNKREARVTPFGGSRSVGIVVEGRF